MQDKKMEYIYPVAKKLGIRKPKYAVSKKKKKAPKKEDLLMKSLQQMQSAARP